jgi:acetyl-CoA synthetase
VIISAGYRIGPFEVDELGDDIKQFVPGRLSAYAYPRRIEFVDELPKTLTGKIRRIELREAERAD